MFNQFCSSLLSFSSELQYDIALKYSKLMLCQEFSLCSQGDFAFFIGVSSTANGVLIGLFPSKDESQSLEWVKEPLDFRQPIVNNSQQCL
jgi:hypothetical protein